MTSSLPIDARASTRMLQASEELRQLETRSETRFAALAAAGFFLKPKDTTHNQQPYLVIN